MTRILVAQDEIDIGALMVDFLGDEGHEVMQARDGVQALASLPGTSRAKTLGASGYRTKPWEPLELEYMVSRTLSECRR